MTVYKYSNSIITNNLLDSYFSEEYVFDMDKKPGFNIAFGMSYYDSNQKMLIEPDIAEIKARIKMWSPSYSGIEWHEVDIRPCTREELGLLGTDFEGQSKFWPVHKDSKDWLEYYWQKLYCYDEEVSVKGDYDSADVSHLQLSLFKCDSNLRSTCKSDEEITKWFQRLFLVTLNNHIRFNQNGYKEETVVYESSFEWHAVWST